MTLEGEIALVTGASRGLGAAIARALAGRGARVVGTATTQEGADAVGAALADAGPGGEGQVLDVSDAASIEALFVDLTSRDSLPSIVVNNAGVTRDSLLARMSETDWDDVITTDLTSVFRISKACVRHLMKARRGRIINVTSVVGVTGNPGQSNYAAAKAGIIGFTRALAREVAARGITVNAVAPGFIDTDMTRGLPDATREQLLEQIPMRRLGTAEDVAETVAYLASPAASYVTGQTLHVNGGMFMG